MDESPRAGVAGGARWRLGLVVPKRHARRAVTRSLLKREMRAAFHQRLALLDAGAWLVRLRGGFDRTAYPSAASRALQRAARAELEALFAGCVVRPVVPR